MRIGSLFSGAGGLDMAVEQVFGGRTVWHCEVDPAASKVLAHRWPGVPNLGDITEVDWAAVEPIDILCGGFPCQDVSAAGRRSGIRVDNRSGLWIRMAAAIDTLQPSVVVIENVRGLLSAKAHRDMEPRESALGDGSGGPILRALGAVLGDLSDIGYDAVWTTLAASAIGACHRRERVFIVAHPRSQRHGRRQDGRVVGRVDLQDEGQDGQWQRARQFAGDRSETPLPVAGWALLPTPQVADATGGHRTRSGARSNELLLNGVLVAHGRGELIGTDDGGELTLLSTPQARDRRGAPKDGYCLSSLPRDALELAASGWGKYEPSVRRWEALTRPAPNPTEPDSSGVKARIRSEFSEWMMGWPAGWVTDLQLTRTEKLVCIGNGVVPQQAVAALRWLLSVSEVAA